MHDGKNLVSIKVIGILGKSLEKYIYILLFLQWFSYNLFILYHVTIVTYVFDMPNQHLYCKWILRKKFVKITLLPNKKKIVDRGKANTFNEIFLTYHSLEHFFLSSKHARI